MILTHMGSESELLVYDGESRYNLRSQDDDDDHHHDHDHDGDKSTGG